MKSNYFSTLLITLLLIAGTLTSVEAQRQVKLRNLEHAPDETYRIVPDANGVPEWVQETTGAPDVTLTPIAYVPTATGNGSNLNEFVIDPNGEIWFIDASGNALQVSSTADGSETKLSAGNYISITGAGTTGSPYVINYTGGAGGTMVNYSAGSGAHVWASGYGITFTKNASTGEYTFSIPDGEIIYRAVVDGDVADDDGNGELFVAFNYAGSRTFNADLVTAWRPRVTVWESGGSAPSRSSPKNMLPVNVQGISSVGSGDIEIALQNVSTITPNPVFEFNFL